MGKNESRKVHIRARAKMSTLEFTCSW